MDDNFTCVLKKKRLCGSKKRKKAWRKFSDVQDVEEYQHDRRTEAITGGPPGDKPNEQLFFVHKGGDKGIPSSRRQTWKTRPLRCFQILTSSSYVPPPIKPNVIGRKRLLDRINNRLELKRKAEERKGFKKRLEIERNLLLNAKREEESKKPVEDSVGTYDIWDSNIEGGHDDYELTIDASKKVKVPETYYKKTSGLPHVEVPDPGASYNPAFADFHDLLYRAHKVELKKVKQERKIQRSFNKMVVGDKESLDASWLQEMSQGILIHDDKASIDDDVSLTPLSINPPVRDDKRKSAVQRRREARRKKIETKQKLEKREAIRETEIFRIRSLKAEIAREERKNQEAQLVRRQKKREKALYGPAIIGKYRYRPPDIEVNLSDELTGSLRNLKTDGHLLLDRLKSFQRRNIIEPGIKHLKPEKPKLTTYVKHGHYIKK